MHCHVEAIEKPIDEQALRGSAVAVLRVTGMGCANCATRVRNSVLKLPGVLAAQVQLGNGLVRVNFASERTGLQDLLDAVADAGAGSHHHYHGTLGRGDVVTSGGRVNRKLLSARLLVAVLGTLSSLGCRDALGPVGTTTVLSVVPPGGTTGVDPSRPIEIQFTHSMRMGMERYAALHERGVTGPVVSGIWLWSDGYGKLTFTPAVPLKAATQYTIHLGGGMRDADGGVLNYDHCTSQHGGQWATQSMMGAGMMSGTSSMMGTGWRHPNGTYGMLFVFTTE